MARVFVSVYITILFLALCELFISVLLPSVRPSPQAFFNPFATDENRDAGVREAFVSSYYLEDPELFWRLNPGKGGGEISGEGFRAKRPYEEKKDSVYRILAIGDSCTFGVGAEGMESTYPARLEAILGEGPGGERVEVINAGVPGYASLQGLRYLRKLLPRYKPDLVLVQFLHNDGVAWLDRPDSKVVVPGESARKTMEMLRKWRFYELLKRCVLGLKRRAVRSGHPAGEKPCRVSPEEYERNLAEMAKLAKGLGAGVLLVVPPALPPYRFRPDFTDYRDATMAAARETGAYLLDLTETFDAVDNARALFWKPEEDDLAHLNSTGYALQAEVMAGRVRKIIGERKPL